MRQTLPLKFIKKISIFSRNNRVTMKIWDSSHHIVVHQKLFTVSYYKICSIVWPHLNYYYSFECVSNAQNRLSRVFYESRSRDGPRCKCILIQRSSQRVVRFSISTFQHLYQARSWLCYMYIMQAQKMYSKFLESARNGRNL